MHLTGAQVIELSDMDLDFLALDKLHEVSLVIEDAKAVADEHWQSPWFQLSRLWVLIELHERHDIVTQDAPESIDNTTSESSTVQETPDGIVAIRIAPYAGAEPRQEARVWWLSVSLWEQWRSRLYNILASASIHCLSGVTNGGAIQHGPWPVAKPKSVRSSAYRSIFRDKTYGE